MNKIILPELLSPAGSPEAFEAAIDGGADAIYVGGASFNARINAQNFSDEDLANAVRLAHLYGVKVYQTINIMMHGRELNELLRAAERSAAIGVDAFIVSDLGAASLIRAHLPEMPLHASTQMSVHNSSGARLLANYGFSRVVPARELSKENIRSLVENNPLEVEIFIHGAMCVSHSGQCLFSSLVGGRSGNRGLCAQPCRLPYACADQRVGDKYPLSLKDMSLAGHVREIIDSGVASLKIEGRMKSPEYVRGVTKIWRRLLDEGRDATADDFEELSALFSRGGFSDGYYIQRIDRKMLGVRSEEDKKASREIDKFTKIQRKVPVDMRVSILADSPSSLTLSCNGKEVTVRGEMPQTAINAPINEDTVKKCMSKLGDTCFSIRSLDIDLDSGLMMPISFLNALRREGIAALEVSMTALPAQKVEPIAPKTPYGTAHKRNVGRFYSHEQITIKAKEYFDVVLLPLDKYAEDPEKADGFFMPPVIFDSEIGRVSELLTKSRENGAKYAVITNIGQIEMLKEALPDINMIADFRFNVANDETVCFLENLGVESTVLSTELTLPQLRDLHGAKAAVVYGRIPLMTLEKCVIKALYGERGGCEVCSQNKAEMKDRRGFVFPILREPDHRNVVLNSLPTNMSDRQKELTASGIVDRHFLFTTETPAEVDRIVDDYQNGRAHTEKVRRI
ncbi:MAG: U32 family peptidase [Clostridia bacterium]|nr:U32 family peptidase [Clostridia bacterium]